jgi:hypothetical protein
MSLRGRVHLSAAVFPSPSSFLFPSPAPDGGSTGPHRAGDARWDGCASQATRSPRYRPRPRANRTRAGRGKTSFTPRPIPCGLARAVRGGGAATGARAVQAGAAWGFRPPLAAPGFKSKGGGGEPVVHRHQPHWGFPLSTPIRESTVRGSRRRRRCCAGPREDAATPAHRRRARRGVRRDARRTGRRRGREPGAGARTGAAEYIAGVNTYTTGGIYYAGNAFTARNTDATPPIGRPRLHRRPP